MIELHASTCNGKGVDDNCTPTGTSKRKCMEQPKENEPMKRESFLTSKTGDAKQSKVQKDGINDRKIKSSANIDAKEQWSKIIYSARSGSDEIESYPSSSDEPIPGLRLYEEFISIEEEEEIIRQLDGKGNEKEDQYLPWRPSTFNGKHFGKRWGVHCSLRDRKVYPEDNPLPSTIQSLAHKISEMKDVMKMCKPNEANAIDYRRANGDYLRSHVDDRQLSKEPIANLSLVGDCWMIFRKERPPYDEKKVLLKRRTLQILTGSARYDYSHGLRNEDLLSDRRVSVTMRESPVSK